MDGLDRTQVIELIIVGIFVSAAIARLIVVEVQRYNNPKPFVAYGSMKNWYNQSPNFVFRLARKIFGPIKEQQSSDKATAQLHIPPEVLSNGSLFQRDLSDFQIFEIDNPTRLSIVEFTLRVLGFDAAGSLIRLNRTLRPGDLTEIRHRAYQTRSIVIAGPINCRHQWQPRQLTHDVNLTDAEFDRLVAMLAQDRTFVMLCIKYAGFLDNLVKAALDIVHTENDSIALVRIPSQAHMGTFVNLNNELYPELATH